MFKYQELDMGRNEIRLLTVLGLTTQNSDLDSEPGSPPCQEGLVECTLENFSLNEYTPEYSRFLKIEEGRSTISQGVLWDQITQGEDPLVSKVAQQQTAGLLHETLAGHNSRSLYSNREEYNENTTRWTWGDFDALSYFWGDPEDKRDIIINKQRFAVNKNLEEALRNYVGWKEEYEKHTRIWTDAVCINQKDIPERNLQVKRMKDIYQQAHTVFAWIGSDLVGGEFVESLLDEILDEVDLTSPDEREALDDFVENIPSRYDNLVWEGVIDLLSRPYWGRLWIIQEILLANSGVRLCFGHRNCLISSWFLLFSAFRHTMMSLLMPKAMEVFSSRPEPDLAFSAFQRNFTQMERLVDLDQYKYAGSARPSLTMLLDAGRNAEQMDPRDKVYALLGLMDPAVQDLVIPEYRALELQIYRDFVRSVIRATRKLNIIFQGASKTVGSKGFPSWLPDWSVRNEDGGLGLFNNERLCATRNTEHVDISDGDETHLLCRGIEFDLIDGLGCGGNLGDDHTDHDVVTSTLSMSAPNPYGDDEGVRNALWETFTIGRLTKLTPAVSSLFKALPWFDENTADSDSETPIYDFFDEFQQCNSGFQIAGKSLEHYFPTWSPDFSQPPDDPTILFEFSLLILPLLERRLTTTKKGYVGFVPKKSAVGDRIFILMGCDVPLILRPCGKGVYRLVGECYVHGIMKGEAMEALNKGKYVLETVTLC